MADPNGNVICIVKTVRHDKQVNDLCDLLDANPTLYQTLSC